MSRRPRIGITAARRRGRVMTVLNMVSILRAGGWPVVLAPDRRESPAGLDGFVIGGGDDIDVSLYDDGPQLETRIDPERDRLELAVLDYATAHGAPVLGICRGAQMINIFMGGTLHRDIHDAYRVPRLRTVLPRRHVHVAADSLLARLLNTPHTRVNVLHHQAMDVIGTGLRVVARDEHGIVQAVEHLGMPLRLGVQWHPEFLFYQGRQRNLFGAVVAAAKGAYSGRDVTGLTA